METKHITIWSVGGWFFGVIFGISGIAELFTKPLGGILSLLIAAIALPPVTSVLKRRYNFSIPAGLKVILGIGLFIGSLYILGTKPGTQSAIVTTTPTPVASVVATPARTPAPKPVQPIQTPVPTPKPVPVLPSYHPIFTFNGTGAKTSEPFTITGSRFKIAYSCNGGYCGASLYYADGALAGLIVNTTQAINDETVFYGAGTYYIDANMTGSFMMTVEDYR